MPTETLMDLLKRGVTEFDWKKMVWLIETKPSSPLCATQVDRYLTVNSDKPMHAKYKKKKFNDGRLALKEDSSIR